MKQLLKRIVPYKVRILRSAAALYLYDLTKFIHQSSAYERFDTEQKMKGYLTKMYHVVEKGLTMPETRLGFGKANVLKLIHFCELYKLKGFCQDATEFTHSIKTLNEYLAFHEVRNFPLEPSIVSAVQRISKATGIFDPAQQRFVSRQEFFRHIGSPFPQFCLSRNSVRNFTEEPIPLSTLHRCVELAQASPSPCNRQPNRIYIIQDKKTMEEVLKLQNGNRGFGHLGNALIIFTSDISIFHDTFERNEMYLNSGMFSMSFIYALHSFQIGSCALNWSVPIKRDKALRKLLTIPDNEVITLTLVCGYVPDEFKIACSPKLNWETITTNISCQS